MKPAPLPIDAHVDRIREETARHRAAVVVAPPGSGKTTRVAPALVDAGPVLLLQPRRMAARALARRIGAERGWEPGEEVGWQVRFERRFSPRTRLLVATEGVLTARLQSDPLLSGFATVVLDEFHERSLHADLALALLRESREARDDLRVVVMSATLDPAPVQEFLGGCPAVDVPGRAHPLEVEHAPGVEMPDAVLRVLRRAGGHLLAFLPGAPEIERCARELRPRLPAGCELLPLHGSLGADAQDRALAPSSCRKVILATNIAETSLTVDGVTDVVDGGTHKVMRRDEALGFDRLELERISRDSADQRAGRAGRTGPGRVLRLWDERDELRPAREPEILRVDLAPPLLAVLAQGADPARFRWFEPPDPSAVRAALALLERLGAARGGGITPLGRALLRLPLHPRLGRVWLGCGGTPRASAACAVLDDGWSPPGVDETTACDLSPAVDRLREAPRRVQAAARQLERLARAVRDALEEGALPGEGEERLRRALLAAYPDRVAQRRERGSSRIRLANGHGALLTTSSGVREGALLVALELRAARRGANAEARVTRAARIEREWLEPTGSEVAHEIDPASLRVRAVERVLYERLVLGERPAAVDGETAARMQRDAWLARGLPEEVRATLRRLRFAGIEIDVEEALLDACRACSARRAPAFDPLQALDWKRRRELERSAPERLRLPSGREVRLDYRDDGTVVAAAKLQELFGLADSPRLGAGGEPVTFSLLAPNGRPVQTTRDLRSFWNGAYAQVRAELRGRYPKHPWPEDPWSAEPTARIRPRKRRPAG